MPKTPMPAEKFRAAVQSAAIGSTKDVPHLTEALIDKYGIGSKQIIAAVKSLL